VDECPGVFPAGAVGREATFPAGRVGSASPDTPKALHENDFWSNKRGEVRAGCDSFPAVSRAAGKTPNYTEK
jgi:hypothetical protein